MSKSRSWTFPSYPSPAVGAALVPFAGCQHWFRAFLCLTFLCTAGEEAASPREEDSDAEGEDAAEGEEVCDAVLEVQYSVLEVRGSFLLEFHRSFLEVQCGVLEVHRSFVEIQCGERERLPTSASPH